MVIRNIFSFLLLLSLLYSQETLPLTESEKLFSLKTNLFLESDSLEILLVYRGFVVRYNLLAKSPEYTIHRLTYNQIDTEGKTPAARRSTFWVDDNQLMNKSSLNIDFKGSGFDRGHMVPAGDFTWDQLKKNETFVLSNICAQSPQLNRGIWNQLEEVIRKKVLLHKDTAYIITGAIYDDRWGLKIGIDSVWVAKYFYKLIYFKNQNQMYSFLFSHGTKTYSGVLSSFQVRVDDIEIILDKNFYDKLPDDLEMRLESELNIIE